MDFNSIKSYFTIKGKDQGDKVQAVCPCHNDKQASLSISYDSKDQKTLVFCHAGCETRDILGKAGLKISDLFDKEQVTKSSSSKNIVAVYPYKDASEKVLFEKIRFNPKGFAQRRNVNGAIVWGLDGGIFYETYPGSNNWSKKKKDNATTQKFEKLDPVIYNLPQVIEAVKNNIPVYIVEGEKDADNLIKIGLVATCNFDGASKNTQKPKWHENYNEIFKDAIVRLIPDQDNPGKAHMNNIALNLKSFAKEIKIINLPVTEKGDISDWLNEGNTKEELLELIDKTEIWQEDDSTNKSILNFNFSDVGNAERLIYLHGKNIRYNSIRGKWMIWSGKHWEIDMTGKIERLSKGVIRKLQQEGLDLDGDEEDNAVIKKNIRQFVLKSENDGRIKAMINQAKSQPGIAMNDTDKDIFLINLSNGTLDLKNNKFKAHDRKDNITKLININFDIKATCPNWEKFLDKIFKQDKELIEYIQRTVGYTLTGDISQQCFYILYGSGANGKSTFLKAIEDIMSDYADTLKGSSLMVKRNDDGARGDLAKLQSKRFVMASELNEGQTFDESLIKALTGGDTIPVRYLYGEEFPLKPQFKIWIGTNEKPRVKGTNHGIWRRMRIIPFLHTFSEDDKDENFYENNLKSELPGILNWAIAGCVKWQKYGIETPEQVKLAVDDYKTEMDVIQRFIEDCCILEPKCNATVSDLYDVYTKWCEEMKEHELSSIKFSKKISQKGFIQNKNRYSRFWEGIGIVDTTHKDYKPAYDNIYPFEQGKF